MDSMERLEIIKNAQGPMLRCKLVQSFCEDLLASGSLRGYTLGYTQEMHLVLLK